MKKLSHLIAFLLLAAFPLSLIAQDNPTLVLEYMKVKPQNESTYLEIEKTWKEIHKMRIDEGLSTGWQLWRNIYAAANDPYQYITINWYKDYAHSFQKTPEGFWERVQENIDFEDGFDEKVLKSRTLVEREITHQAIIADNTKPSSIIVVNRMKVKSGKENEYMGQEWSFWKPIQEEAIRKGYMAHWGVYVTWPFKEGQIRHTTVDGYESYEQFTMSDKEDLLPVVHPDTTWAEVTKSSNSVRKMASREVWELVDAVFPEQE